MKVQFRKVSVKMKKANVKLEKGSVEMKKVKVECRGGGSVEVKQMSNGCQVCCTSQKSLMRVKQEVPRAGDGDDEQT